MNDGYTYIMSNFNRTTLYIGVTNDILRRLYEHKTGQGSAFTRKYKLTVLLYYEFHERITDAIDQEKKLKNWHRDWKFNLIKSVNPDLEDLAFTELGFEPGDFEQPENEEL